MKAKLALLYIMRAVTFQPANPNLYCPSMASTKCPRGIPAVHTSRLTGPARVSCSWRTTRPATSSASVASASFAPLQRKHAAVCSSRSAERRQSAGRCARRPASAGQQLHATPLLLSLLHKASRGAHAGRRELLLVQCKAATSQATTEAESASDPDEPARLLTLVRGFERRVVTARGVELRVRPLATNHLEEVTDLLTDSFMDLLGSFTYRPLLRLEVWQRKKGALRWGALTGEKRGVGGAEYSMGTHCNHSALRAMRFVKGYAEREPRKFDSPRACSFRTKPPLFLSFPCLSNAQHCHPLLHPCVLNP